MTPQLAVTLRSDGPRLEEAESVSLDIYDVIGKWWGEGVGAKDVLDQLKSAKSAKTIKVRINSGGGDAWDGIAIYNLLHQNKAKIVVEVDGIAASAASVIAMAGDEIRVAENALLMIHNPWSMTVGEASDMRAKADELDKLRDVLVSTYVARTGRSREEVVKWMDDETWMTAEEAVDLGFATHVTAAKQAAAMLPTNLDSSRFSRLPMAVRAQFDRLAEAAPAPVAGEIKVSVDVSSDVQNIIETLEAVADRISGDTQTHLSPAPIEPPTSKDEISMTTPNASIAAALGLPVGSTENDVLTACARMRNLEVEAVAITGAKSTSEALGAIRALKQTADGAAKLKADLDKVTGERDAQNFDALVQRGESLPVKLTPATTKLYRDRFAAAVARGSGSDVVEELKGFLEVAPTIIAPPREQPAINTGSAGQALAWNGKGYADMSGPERHKLWRDNPELFRAMSDAFDAELAG